MCFEITVLHLLALALLIVVAVAWGRHGRRRFLVASGFITVLAVTLIYLQMVRPSDIPIDWITIIHEGTGYKSILHLYMRAVHADVSFKCLLPAVLGPQPGLHDVVWLNMLLALVNAVIFLHVALYFTGATWAVVWTLVFALNPATFLAAFSELPTGVLNLYFLAGVIGWATLTDPLYQPRVIRGSGYVLCALFTLFAAFTRVEVALIGVVALGLHAACTVLGSGTLSDAWTRLLEACERPLVFLSQHPGVVAILCLAGLYFSQAGLPWEFMGGRAEVSGVYPFNPSIVTFHFFLPMLLLPIGVAVATFFGFIHAIIHFRRFGGLALSLLVLIRMYFAAQDQFYETGRYLSYLFPAIFLLGLFGKDQLYEIARRWSPNWYHATRVVFIMVWFTRPFPGAPDFFLKPEYDWGAGFSQVLLDLNTQREVRHLLSVTEENSECVFVGRVVIIQEGFRVAPEYAYVVFGKPVTEPIVVPEKEASLEEVIARHAAAASCIRLYYGGDCNLTFADRCEQFVAGRRLLDEHRFWSRLYNNPHDYGYAEGEVVLAVYDWP
jgi:hypothetical protein